MESRLLNVSCLSCPLHLVVGVFPLLPHRGCFAHFTPDRQAWALSTLMDHRPEGLCHSRFHVLHAYQAQRICMVRQLPYTALPTHLTSKETSRFSAQSY